MSLLTRQRIHSGGDVRDLWRMVNDLTGVIEQQQGQIATLRTMVAHLRHRRRRLEGTGTDGMIWRGAYDSGVDYEEGDVVTIQPGAAGGTYVCQIGNGPGSTVHSPADGDQDGTGKLYWAAFVFSGYLV